MWIRPRRVLAHGEPWRPCSCPNQHFCHVWTAQCCVYVCLFLLLSILCLIRCLYACLLVCMSAFLHVCLHVSACLLVRICVKRTCQELIPLFCRGHDHRLHKTCVLINTPICDDRLNAFASLHLAQMMQPLLSHQMMQPLLSQLPLWREACRGGAHHHSLTSCD